MDAYQLEAHYAYCEACTSQKDRRRFLPATYWRNLISKGVDQERHQSIGQFDHSVVTQWHDEKVDCMVPFLPLESEEGDLRQRHRDTANFLYLLRDRGIDRSGIVVRFSGNKSFHILIPCGKLGNQRGSVAFHKTLYTYLFGVYLPDLFSTRQIFNFDLALFDPRHLIRMQGSVHPGTGGRVIDMGWQEFLTSTLTEILEWSNHGDLAPARHSPFHVPPDKVLTSMVAEVMTGSKSVTKAMAHFEMVLGPLDFNPSRDGNPFGDS